MKQFIYRLYLSSFISSLGSWLTFLAIAMSVKEKYGVEHVAWVFLAQTLPAIIFSRKLSELLDQKHHSSFYFWSHIVLAMNSLALCLNDSLQVIYLHLFIWINDQINN